MTRMIVMTMCALLLAVAPAFAKGKKHSAAHSPAHDAATARCGEIYEATAAAAKAPNSPTGKARMQAMHAAAEAKKACIAKAPK